MRYNVFDSFLDVFFGVDSEAKIFYGNAAASLLFGVSAKRLANGRKLDQVINFEPDPFAMLQAAQSGDEATKVLEVKFTVADGKTGWGQLVFQPETDALRDPEQPQGPRRWIGCMRDVSLEKTLHEKYRGEIDQKESVIAELKEARTAVEKHSRELESTVAERTQELSGTNRMLKTILDSLGQGILVFDRLGICLSIYSQVCRRLLEIDPNGRLIEDVLNLYGPARKNFELWRGAVFDQLLDFEDMVPLTLRRMTNKSGAEISLDYYPMFEPDGRLAGIVVVTTDRTIEMQALQRAERERELVQKVTRVARNREAFRMFIVDAVKLINDLKEAESLDLQEVGRRLHTLKGGAASFSLALIVDNCHHLEDDLKANAIKDRAGFNQFLRLKADEILATFNHEIKMLSDLLGPFNSGAGQSVVELPTSRLRAWSTALLQASDLRGIHEIGIEIQECGEKPVSAAIQHMGSALTELAVSRGKVLKSFTITGGEIKVPEDFAQELLLSLVHALRNSVYHGLEDAIERKAMGKSEGGQIAVNFRITSRGEQEWLKIDIEDDGRGIDPNRIRTKLSKQGLQHLAVLPDEKVLQSVLRDDFSMSETVDKVAGRGVGMAAIAAEVRKLGGTIEIISTIGMGATLKISVPMPRSIQKLVRQVS